MFPAARLLCDYVMNKIYRTVLPVVLKESEIQLLTLILIEDV
jgi:hypothetical protein